MKGVDSKKYDRCVKQVKAKQGKKVNAWAVCAASLKKNEKESKMKDKVKKAEVSETIVESPKTTEVQAAVAEAATVQKEEIKLEATPVVEAQVIQKEEVKAPTVKLKGNLFNGFTLGSTLAQSPVGNVMTNMKASPMDYQKTYQNSTKNQNMTSEQLKGSVKKGK